MGTRRDLPLSVPVTALRVFEPLEAFAPAQRRVLATVVADPAAGRRAEESERRRAWRRVLGLPDAPGEVHARVLRVDGGVLVCPVASEPHPDSREVVDAGGGPAAAAEGFTGVGGWMPERSTGARSGGSGSSGGASGAGAAPVPPRRHTLVSAWDLPVAWLAIVRVEDLTTSGGPSRYVLPMARARARAARTLRTLRSHLGELDVTADAEGLARWLEFFHPRSWVEVDARPVAALVDGDDGAEDIRLGLESLTAGEGAAVAAAYQRLRKRSRRLEELSVSS